MENKGVGTVSPVFEEDQSLLMSDFIFYVEMKKTFLKKLFFFSKWTNKVQELRFKEDKHNSNIFTKRNVHTYKQKENRVCTYICILLVASVFSCFVI